MNTITIWAAKSTKIDGFISIDIMEHDPCVDVAVNHVTAQLDTKQDVGSWYITKDGQTYYIATNPSDMTKLIVSKLVKNMEVMVI